MVYYILLIWIFEAMIFCFCTTGKICFRKNRNTFIVLSFIAIIYLLGMRDLNVGADTKSYCNMFDKVALTPFSEIIKHYYFSYMEVGYIVLMKVVSFLGNYLLFQIIISIITNILFFKFIKENFENYFVGVMLFLSLDVFFLLFNLSRQMLAVALVINCWSYLNHKKRVMALCFLVCAGFIHTTAWLFIGFFMVYFMKKCKLFIKLIPVIGITALFFYQEIIDIAYFILPHYANYYGNHKTIMEAGFAKIIWLIILVISLITIIKKIKIIDIKNNSVISLNDQRALNWHIETYLYASFSLFYVVTNIIGLSFNYFERIGCYFVPFVTVTFERFGTQIKNPILRRIYFNGIIICFSVYFILSSRTDQYIYNFWGQL